MECVWCGEAATDNDEDGDPCCAKHTNDVRAEMLCRTKQCTGTVHHGRSTRPSLTGLCRECRARVSVRESSERYRIKRKSSARTPHIRLVANSQ